VSALVKWSAPRTLEGRDGQRVAINVQKVATVVVAPGEGHPGWLRDGRAWRPVHPHDRPLPHAGERAPRQGEQAAR